ncbi:Coiled-coil domain-containing protein [Campylobacter sp. MIT 19-121]|uniref:Coiled-coil domain-containing protein n=1 Tax=Campylobacter sp. MIT 19-121 TaxID=2703906 RepID=UPI001389F81F|nr:Coiled-coil domain-containing protein [Campylobacter sp. MIT 19-121]NDJ26365.1 Coiled-coil domain-containing protein [Campylobacter sp. MIT 19-121]
MQEKQNLANLPAPPQDEPAQNEPTPPQSEFDTSADEAELNATLAELDQARASLESSFAKHMAQSTDAELETLFFENKEAFYQKVLEAQNAFLEQNIAPKAQKAEALEASIGQKKAMGQIEAAQNAFLQNHPEADMSVLMDFFSNDLPPKVMNELENLPPEEFFEALYEIYTLYTNPNQTASNTEEKLPQKIAGSPINSNDQSPSSNTELPFNRL